jgi:hypothetical protein
MDASFPWVALPNNPFSRIGENEPITSITDGTDGEKVCFFVAGKVCDRRYETMSEATLARMMQISNINNILT